MTSFHEAAGKRIGRIAGRSASGGVCDVRELRSHCRDAIACGVNFLEIDLTTVERIETGLIGFLAEMLRYAREQRVLLKLKPSLALDRWLRECGLDHDLRPVRAGAA